MSDISPGPQSSPLIKASYARYVFWVMFAISFLNYLDRSVLSGAINEVAKELHFGLEGIGFISSAFLVIYTLGIMPLGILADRMARKNVVATTVAVWSVITALTALATNFTTLFISRMLLGIGEAGYFPAGTADWDSLRYSDWGHRRRALYRSVAAGFYFHRYSGPVIGVSRLALARAKTESGR
jgi:MFS family permease